MIGLTKSYKTLIHRALYLNFKYEELEEIYDIVLSKNEIFDNHKYFC